MTFEYWFMFPLSIAVATTAMASGVEGATFFTPLFILGLGLSPEVAIGAGLITAAFGTASGFSAYAWQRLIDYRLGGALLAATIPMGIAGAALSGHIDPDILRATLAATLIAVACGFRRAFGPSLATTRISMARGAAGTPMLRQIVTRTGVTHRYPEPRLAAGRLITGVGALFLGMISTGLGQLNGYFLIQRAGLPAQVAVATSVFIVSVTALIASTGHFFRFAAAGGPTLYTVLDLIGFTVPGVLIGGQIGPRLAGIMTQRTLERGLAVLFVAVALALLVEIFYR